MAELNIEGAWDNVQKEGVSIILFGASGTGKTWFAGTGGERTVIIDIGGGSTTLRSPAFREANKSEPKLIKLKQELGTDGLPKEKTTLLFDQVCDTLDTILTQHTDDFDAVVVDDMTTLRKSAMYKGLMIGLSTGVSTGLAKAKQHNIVIPAVQDYGNEMRLMEWFVEIYSRMFREAGLNLLLLCHTRYTYNKPRDNSGRVIIGDKDIIDTIRPGFTGKSFPDDVTQHVTEVWYIEKVGTGDKASHRINIYGDEQKICKTRLGGVFKGIETKPNFAEFMKRINNNWRSLTKT